MACFLPSKPGWYPNPMDRSTMRYWDGANWTSRYRPRPPWVSQLSDLELWASSYDRAIEGPVHPHELREPVTSGASARQGPIGWRPWQAHRGWHRPAAFTADPRRAASTAPSAKFGPARRPVLLLVAMVTVALAVVVSSFAVMAPYQADDTPHFVAGPAQSRFIAQATKYCAATIPKYRLTLLTGVDGPSVAAASHQIDLLRQRLSVLDPTPSMQAPVEAWLSDWRQFTTLQRRYAAIVGPAQHRDGRVLPRPLSASAREAALRAHRDALAEARQADHYTSNLHLSACTLETTSPL